MATSEGTYTDIHDLVVEINTFATANGWTQDKYVAGSGATASELYLHNGTQYISLAVSILAAATRTYRNVSQSIVLPRLTLYGNTGFNTGNSVSAQPGSCYLQQSEAPVCHWIFGPGNYKFFTNATGDYIHCVVWMPLAGGQNGGGDYQHIVFGIADRIGGGAGGEYVDATWWENDADYINWEDTQHSTIWDGGSTNGNFEGHIRHPDGSGYEWKFMTADPPVFQDVLRSARGGTRHSGFYFIPDSLAPRETFRTTFAIPIMFGVTDGIYGSREVFRPAYVIKDAMSISLNIIEVGDTFNDGSNDWQVFPVQRKRGPYYNDGANALIRYAISAHVGIAYKII